MNITFTHSISDSRVEDLLCCAIEGGSNYWLDSINRCKGVPSSVAVYRQEVPFVEGGYLEVVPDRWDEMPKELPVETGIGSDFNGEQYRYLKLDRSALEKGLQTMAVKYPHAFGRFLTENEDAGDGDIFLQCCVLGDAIYG